VLEDAGLPHALEAEPAGELEPDLSPEIIMTFEPEVQMTFDRVSLVDEDEPQPTPEHELLDESMELEQLVSVQVIDDVATHTNSMVTIRLSESDVKPSETGALPPTLKALRRSAETPKVRFNEKTSSRKAQEDVEDAEMAADLFMTRRASIDSSLACGEAESIGAELAKVEKLGRSDSVASFSSGDSQHVDWDKLDKNEEQTQRDEGADEVNFSQPCYRESADQTRAWRFFSLVSNRKIMLWLKTPRPVLHNLTRGFAVGLGHRRCSSSKSSSAPPQNHRSVTPSSHPLLP
jgi:hypothetical protein